MSCLWKLWCFHGWNSETIWWLMNNANHSHNPSSKRQKNKRKWVGQSPMVYSERLCSEICRSFEIIAAAVRERMRIRGGYSSRDTVPGCACVVFCSVFKGLPAFLAATQDCLRLFRMKCDKQDALLFVSFKCVYNNTPRVRAPACICVTT